MRNCEIRVGDIGDLKNRKNNLYFGNIIGEERAVFIVEMASDCGFNAVIDANAHNKELYLRELRQERVYKVSFLNVGNGNFEISFMVVN